MFRIALSLCLLGHLFHHHRHAAACDVQVQQFAVAAPAVAYAAPLAVQSYAAPVCAQAVVAAPLLVQSYAVPSVAVLATPAYANVSSGCFSGRAHLFGSGSQVVRTRTVTRVSRF